MDDFEREFNNLFDMISENIHEIRGVVEEEIEKKANAVFMDMKRNTPVKSGRLQRSLTIKQLNQGSEYFGYKIEYSGDNANGDSNEKIARILNSGHGSYVNKNTGRSVPAQAGVHFITNAVRKLKPLSKNIEKAIDKKLDDISFKT